VCARGDGDLRGKSKTLTTGDTEVHRGNQLYVAGSLFVPQCSLC
jgi:hypothetical protein